MKQLKIDKLLIGDGGVLAAEILNVPEICNEVIHPYWAFTTLLSCVNDVITCKTQLHPTELLSVYKTKLSFAIVSEDCNGFRKLRTARISLKGGCSVDLCRSPQRPKHTKNLQVFVTPKLPSASHKYYADMFDSMNAPLPEKPINEYWEKFNLLTRKCTTYVDNTYSFSPEAITRLKKLPPAYHENLLPIIFRYAVIMHMINYALETPKDLSDAPKTISLTSINQAIHLLKFYGSEAVKKGVSDKAITLHKKMVNRGKPLTIKEISGSLYIRENGKRARLAEYRPLIEELIKAELVTTEDNKTYKAIA